LRHGGWYETDLVNLERLWINPLADRVLRCPRSSSKRDLAATPMIFKEIGCTIRLLIEKWQNYSSVGYLKI